MTQPASSTIQRSENATHPDVGPDGLQMAYALHEATLTLHDVHGEDLTFERLHQAIDALGSRHAFSTLRIPTDLARRLPLTTHHWRSDDEGLWISRPAFYQIREAWLSPALWPVMPETFVEADCPGGRHPLRPRIGNGRLYRKRLAATGEVFELRRAEIDRDGERFHRWQNDPRVAQAWEEDGPREKTDAYLQTRLDDPHCEPLIGEIDGEPFAYIETYWAREDRLGPYYDVDDYDQGFHVLVGEPRFLGKHRTTAWMRAMAHYLFLLDPRTRRLVGEPRADNTRMIERATAAGWRAVKEFDFPHKRALLMLCDRETFFREGSP